MYCVGTDLHDERDFYGREALLAELMGSSQPSVFLHGFRRTGKTAVLLAMERAALLGDRLLPLLLVLQGQRNLDDVRDDLAGALRRRQRAFPELPLAPLLELRRLPLDALVTVAQDAASQVGRGLLLLLDEADTLLRLAAQFPAGLARLRAALPRGASDRVVLTGARSTLALAAPSLAGDEPFLTGFARRLLPPVLDEGAARSLVALEKRGGQGAVRLPPPMVEELLAKTGGHPFLIQAACDHLRTHGGDVARAVASVVALRASSEAFYADLQRISPSEREVLNHHLRGGPVPPDLELYRRTLVELGVVDGTGAFRVPALVEWLKQTGWRNIPPLLRDDQVVSPPRFGGPDQGAVQFASGGLRYRLLRKLGGGGMSEVFLIRLMDTGGFQRLAALKVLRGQWERDEAFAAQIRDEGRLLGQLHHKAIVRVEFPVEVEGRFGLIMEYVPGVDLSDLIADRSSIGSLPPRALAEVIAEVATALDVAARRIPEEGTAPLGVLHRDIKPANIRLTRDGEVKVLDFGIATVALATRDLAHDAFGTPGYLSPERVRGEAAVAASDIYALGLVLLEAGLGILPHLSPESEPAHARALALSLSRLPTGLAGLRPLAAAMLAWDPGARPTAAEVARQARALVLAGPSLLDWSADRLPAMLELQTLPPSLSDDRPVLKREGTLVRWEE